MRNNNEENVNRINQDISSLSEKQSKKLQFYFDNSINISEIENKENKDLKESYLHIENKNNDNSLKISLYLDNQSIHQNNKEIYSNNNAIKKKLTKEDLDNIPLPIFSCIYCSNDYLPFKHLSNEILVSKYYNLTSIFDMKILDKLIQYQPLIDQDHKNHRIIDIIIKNTDYLKKYYKKDNSLNYYISQNFKMFYINNNLKITKYFLQRIEDSLIRKKNKDLTNKKYNKNKNKIISYKLSFHHNSTTNDIVNNIIGNTKNNSNTIGTGTCAGTGSYSSMNNIISLSLNNNENNNNNINNNNNNIICLNNLNMMENIMEKIEKNTESENDYDGGEEFLNIFGNESQMQMDKKIIKNKIDFEDKYYDIWNPIITIIDENESNITESGIDKKENNEKCNKQNNKVIFNDNYRNNYLEKREKKFKDIFSYSQTTYLNNKIITNLNNKKRKLNKLNFKRIGLSETNCEFFKNNEKCHDLILNNNHNNNLLKFKSVYINRNERNKNNHLFHNFDSNNNILDAFNKNKINYYESLSLNKEVNKSKDKEEKEKNKINKISDLDKFKNMTININNNASKNLLFLLKHPKTTSHSNQMNQKMVNININNPKITNDKLSSIKNDNNINEITFKPQENSSARIKKAINKKFNFNNILCGFNNLNKKNNNNRNMSKKRQLLNRHNIKNIKSNSILGYEEHFEHFRNKSGFSSCTHFQINLSKILHKNKPKEKANELVKKIFNNRNYKININDFLNQIKKEREIKNNNVQKINNNYLIVPLLKKRSASVSKHIIPKIGLTKKKL